MLGVVYLLVSRRREFRAGGDLALPPLAVSRSSKAGEPSQPEAEDPRPSASRVEIRRTRSD